MSLLVRINLALIATFAARGRGRRLRLLHHAAAQCEAAGHAGSRSHDGQCTCHPGLHGGGDPASARFADAPEFLPQSVPFYAASQNFLKLREHHPEYAYKEATFNPTNPRDRATDWEADLIQQFRNDAQSRKSSQNGTLPRAGHCTWRGPFGWNRLPRLPQPARGRARYPDRPLWQQQRLRLAGP